MSLLTTITRRLQTLAYCLEDPKLFALYQQGGNIKHFLGLNQSWLQELNITTVIDVGANIGRFAITVNAAMPKAHIYSFEPLPDCFDRLQTRMKDVKNFTAFNLALGDCSGTLTFERNSFSPSSSFLKMTNLHKAEFPLAEEEQTVVVKVDRLDEIAQSIKINDPLMIKIDTQGYEDRVLRGGQQTIKQAKIIVVETSFEHLYQEQPLFNEVYQQLISWGFLYRGALSTLSSIQTGKNLQEDSIFIKKN